MISREHYFDWAATSPSDEEIIRKAMEISLEHWGNPSSIHEAGVDARKALEEARQRCARAMGVKSEHIYFTSGGTESDHIPLVALLSKYKFWGSCCGSAEANLISIYENTGLKPWPRSVG